MGKISEWFKRLIEPTVSYKDYRTMKDGLQGVVDAERDVRKELEEMCRLQKQLILELKALADMQNVTINQLRGVLNGVG